MLTKWEPGAPPPFFRDDAEKYRLPALFVCLSILVGIGLLGGASPCLASNSEIDLARIRSSIVRVEVVAQIPDYTVPWNPGLVKPKSGTGFLIDGQRILTNAHVSSNARFVALEKEGDSRPYEARVKYIAHDCDLALLEVLDPAFFEGMQPLTLGTVPELDSVVTVLGYPIGGDRLSVTRGVVSRIDFQTYSHSGVDSHLAIQIDAAINPGNSGGPVLQDAAVVGVAFQAFSGKVAQNVGFMIPVPVIRRFLTDVTDGRYDGYVDLGVFQFPLLNAVHRRALGLGTDDSGVMVSGVIAAGAAAGILETGDVLLSIDGLPIFSDGHVEMEGERVLLNEVVERKFKGDSVLLEILRAREKLQVTIPLNSPWPYLMQARRHNVRPRFVMFGGLVFQPLSRDFIAAADIKKIDVLYHYSLFLKNDLYLDRPEIVVISKILPDPINAYLGRFVNTIVDRINGEKILTIEDVAAAFDRPAPEYVIDLVGSGRPVVLDRSSVEEARERIVGGYGVLAESFLQDSIVPADWPQGDLPQP